VSDPINNPEKNEKKSENPEISKIESPIEKKIETPEHPDMEKCPQCGEFYEKSKKPLYCTKCGKILVEMAQTIKPETKIQTREDIFCPRCHFATKLKINPVFCMNCGYRFPRDQSGQILYDEEGYVYVDQMGSNPISNQPSGSYSAPQFTSPGEYNRNYPQPQYFYQIRKPKTWAMGPGFGVPLLAVALQFVLLLVITVASFYISFPTVSSVVTTFLEGAFSLIFMIIPVLWVQRYYSQKLTFKDRLKELGLDLQKYSRQEKVREILIGCLFGVLGVLFVLGLQSLAYILVEKIYGVSPDIYFSSNSTASSQFGMSIPANWTEMILTVLMMLLFVGFPEEIMFRGFVQRCFETKLSKPAATLLTAVYFSLFHIIIYIQSPPLFLFLLIPYLGVSILLGVIRNWRQDLLAGAILHIVYNSIQTVFLFFMFF